VPYAMMMLLDVLRAFPGQVAACASHLLTSEIDFLACALRHHFTPYKLVLRSCHHWRHTLKATLVLLRGTATVQVSSCGAF
jgi:hypothetical protein